MRSRPPSDTPAPPTATPKPQGPLTTALFWLMLFVGGGSLAACLIAPALKDYRDAQERLAAAQARNDELKRQTDARALQIEHHLHDPDYNERFVREEFNVRTPGVETVVVDLPPDAVPSNPPTASDAAATDADPDGAATAGKLTTEAFARRLEQSVRGDPMLSVFVIDEARPGLIALSCALLLGALFLIPGSKRPA